jgi:hypothetical protein
MDVDEKPNVYHIEGVRDEDVGELQLEIEKITLLNEEDFKAEERALLKKVRRPFFLFLSKFAIPLPVSGSPVPPSSPDRLHSHAHPLRPPHPQLPRP